MITRVENLPEEIQGLRQWVCWKKKDKTPKNAHTGGNAKSNDKATWATLDEAVEACIKYNFDGVGFMFANGYFGVDLDNCIDNVVFCEEFVETLGSYAERSQSGSGIHIICKGKLPPGGRRKGGVEMYDSGRYFICTGDIYDVRYQDVVDCTESIKPLHAKYIPAQVRGIPQKRQKKRTAIEDDELIEKAKSCKTGRLFGLLYDGLWEGVYPSQSEADIAFMNQLAFWTGCDAAQMDRIYRASGLMRDKWDRRQNGSTYGEITIDRAISSCTDIYTPADDSTDLAMAFFGNKPDGQKPKKNYDQTDTGNAHRLYDKYGESIRYSYNRSRWYYYDGKRWCVDEAGAIKKLADDICEDLKKEALLEQNEDAQRKKFKFYQRSCSSRNKEAMIKECQHLYDIPISLDDFDQQKDWLNTLNGVINLRNGEFMEHDASYMLSKCTLCEYDTEKKRPELWLRVLNDVFDGSEEMIDYIQRALGYSICASTEEQKMFTTYGMGSNGKSTVLETIEDLLGDYAANVQPESIMTTSKSQSGGGPRGDLARLKNVRFVICEEPQQGVRLNESLIKQLTGGGKITCRYLHGDDFEYAPEYKIWITANHKPVITGTDNGIWRRMALVPFEVTIGKDKVDKHLKYKLRKEYPQILAWLVEGYQKWREDGLHEPGKIVQATKEYRAEMDLVGSFIDQCIMIDYDSEQEFQATELFNIYLKWARANNEYEMTSKRFGMEAQNKLPDKHKKAAGVFYPHIRLTDYGEEILHSMPRQYSW